MDMEESAPGKESVTTEQENANVSMTHE
jgi:hypothetical protein